MTEYWLFPLENADGPVWHVEGERNCYWFSFLSRILGLRRVDPVECADCRITDFSGGKIPGGQFLSERRGLGLSFFETQGRIHCCVAADAEFLWMPAPGFLWRSWFMSAWFRRFRNGAAQMFHGGCVIRNGRALLFTGRSGMGKSTLARRAGECVAADDLCVLLPSADGTVRVIPAPTWSLYYQPFRTLTECRIFREASLAGTVLLGRAEHDRWDPLTSQDSLMGVMRALSDGNQMACMGMGLKGSIPRDLNLRSFEFACHLVRSVPFALFSAGLKDPPLDLFSEFELQIEK